jgi:hypothetical protein
MFDEAPQKPSDVRLQLIIRDTLAADEGRCSHDSDRSDVEKVSSYYIDCFATFRIFTQGKKSLRNILGAIPVIAHKVVEVIRVLVLASTSKGQSL